MEKLDSDDRMLSHDGRFAERDIVQVCHILLGLGASRWMV